MQLKILFKQMKKKKKNSAEKYMSKVPNRNYKIEEYKKNKVA